MVTTVYPTADLSLFITISGDSVPAEKKKREEELKKEDFNQMETEDLCLLRTILLVAEFGYES
jgi:hypothetical protein